MSRPPSWRTVAINLGLRMKHHAHCPDHELAQADPVNCPFCHDRDAYDLFEEKLATERKAGR